MSKDSNPMTRGERRATTSLAGIFGLRMLGFKAHQLFALDQLPVVLNQNGQNRHGLDRQLHRLPVAQKHTLLHVQMVRTKKERFGRFGHRNYFPKYFQIFLARN